MYYMYRNTGAMHMLHTCNTHKTQYMYYRSGMTGYVGMYVGMLPQYLINLTIDLGTSFSLDNVYVFILPPIEVILTAIIVFPS